MSRYAEAHISAQGPGDARPTALQIVHDEGLEGKLRDKVIVITGASSGIGIETARALASTGARLFLTARDLTKCKVALAGFFNPDRMEIVEMDQESLESTLQFTKDGHELQFGVNHLAHFLFFQLLKPALLAGSTPEFNSRVISVSSAAHGIHGMNNSDNYNFQKGGYEPFVAYSQSKMANIYFANELERQYSSQSLHSLSVHPGEINTALSVHLPAEFVASMSIPEALMKRIKSPEQGAATTVWAVIGKEWEGRGGKYLNDVAEAVPADESKGWFFATGYSRLAYDSEKEGRVWNDSLKLVGLDMLNSA